MQQTIYPSEAISASATVGWQRTLRRRLWQTTSIFMFSFRQLKLYYQTPKHTQQTNAQTQHQHQHTYGFLCWMHKYTMSLLKRYIYSIKTNGERALEPYECNSLLCRVRHTHKTYAVSSQACVFWYPNTVYICCCCCLRNNEIILFSLWKPKARVSAAT